MTAQRTSPSGSTSRLRSLVGPEVVAAILVMIVAAIGLVAVNTPPGFASLPSTPAPSAIGAVASPSSPPPTTAPTPAASAGVGGIVATPRPSPTPLPTPTPIAWQSQARSLLIAGDRVIEARESLREALDATPVSADVLSRGLRTLNTNLAIATTAARTLERAGGPFTISSAIRGVMEVASATSLETLKAPLADAPAYAAGSRTVVTSLEALEGRLRDLADAAGIADPYPLASPSPAP